jgi:hypothetical protein
MTKVKYVLAHCDGKCYNVDIMHLYEIIGETNFTPPMNLILNLETVLGSVLNN